MILLFNILLYNYLSNTDCIWRWRPLPDGGETLPAPLICWPLPYRWWCGWFRWSSWRWLHPVLQGACHFLQPWFFEYIISFCPSYDFCRIYRPDTTPPKVLPRFNCLPGVRVYSLPLVGAAIFPSIKVTFVSFSYALMLKETPNTLMVMPSTAT